MPSSCKFSSQKKQYKIYIGVNQERMESLFFLVLVPFQGFFLSSCGSFYFITVAIGLLKDAQSRFPLYFILCYQIYKIYSELVLVEMYHNEHGCRLQQLNPGTNISKSTIKITLNKSTFPQPSRSPPTSNTNQNTEIVESGNIDDGQEVPENPG